MRHKASPRPALALVISALSLVWIGCGSSDTEPSQGSAPPGEATPTPSVEPPTSAPDTPAPEPEPATPPVDLLHAVAADVAVSSAYRDRSSEIAKLFDGDLETAWNSRTGDLVGAWIDVRVPADASVTSIEMTAGFTHRSPSADLFSANHRVARVRVLRDGTELGTYPLDIESRELQTIPVSGAGGVYRIELTELTPGSRAEWREACISELRVMGRAPDAHPAERFPRYAASALPEPRPDPASTDREAFARNLRQLTFDIRSQWMEWERDALRSHYSSGEPGVSHDEAVEFNSPRRRILTRAIALLDQADPLRADSLRGVEARMSTEGGNGWWIAARSDLDPLAAAMAAAAEWTGDQEAQCRWAKVHLELRLVRVAILVSVAREYDDMDDAMGDGAEGPDLSDLEAELDGLAADFERDPRTTVRRLSRVSEPPTPNVREDWPVLQSELSRVQSLCWTGE